MNRTPQFDSSPTKQIHKQNLGSPLKSSTKTPRLRRLSTIKPKIIINTNEVQIFSRWIFLPKSKLKQIWDGILFLILLYVSIFTPYKIGFVEDGDFPGWDIWDNIVDYFFLFDLILTFFCAYYDEESKIITDRKSIALNYVKSWFLVDLLSSIPFYLLFDNTTQRYNSLARISKLPKIYRIVKMIKLTRMIKLRELQYIKIININIGSERFFYACILLLFSCHVVGCLWFFVTSLSENEDWPYLSTSLSGFDQYIISIYWSVQTVLTVGYGDIHVYSWPSRLFAIFWMILSVYVFSFAVGSLASVLDRMDQANQTYLKRLNTLKTIKKEFHISNQIFQKVKKELKTGKKNSNLSYNILLDDLPPQIRVELAYTMNKKLADEIAYFENKPTTFIATIGPLLTPLKVGAHEYVFMTGDPAEEVYFVKSGKLAVVLPQYMNFKFLMIKPGSYFGEIDILFYGEKRKYTIMTTKKCEFFVLSRKHFKQIYLNQFREEGQKLIQDSQQRKEMLKEAYEEAMHFIGEQEEFESNSKPKLRNKQKFVTQKFTKSINSISSKSMKSGQREQNDSNKRSQIDQAIPEVQEEDDQEKETEAFMNLMDSNQYKKKINSLEKLLKAKDQIIDNIQQELDELMMDIQLKNLDAISEKYKIENNFENQLQLRRELKAVKKLQNKNYINKTFTKSPTNALRKMDSIPIRDDDVIDFLKFEELNLYKEEHYDNLGLKIIFGSQENNELKNRNANEDLGEYDDLGEQEQEYQQQSQQQLQEFEMDSPQLD